MRGVSSDAPGTANQLFHSVHVGATCIPVNQALASHNKEYCADPLPNANKQRRPIDAISGSSSDSEDFHMQVQRKYDRGE
eukprot:2553711-Pyramimonas_sp.AAC.1